MRFLRSTAVLLVALPALAHGQARTTAKPQPGAARTKAAAPPAGAAKDLETRTLEERVSDLKEKIFRTKARLTNLQEMVVGGDATVASKAVLVQRNEMGSPFQLESVAYALDGAPIYTKLDADGDLARREELEIFNGHVGPGDHQLTVQLTYRAAGYRLFTYADGYRFKVRSSHRFVAQPGKVNTIRVVGFDRDGFTAELQDRPAIRFDVNERDDAGPATIPAAAEGGNRR